MDSREARLARNQAIFRELNERVAHSDKRSQSADPHVFLCECANADCTTRVYLTLRDYQRVRANPLRFVVAHGHQGPDIERVVQIASRFLVVEKTGPGAEVAIKTDPRADAGATPEQPEA